MPLLNPKQAIDMPKVTITRKEFLADRQGKTFADVVDDSTMPFDDVLRFFSDADRQQRMEDSEIHHDRTPLAGVVRELESLPAIHQMFTTADPGRSKRLRQAIGVVVRMIMERRGWERTGKKGSLGVRAAKESQSPYHNTGGLAFWFIRAERYRRTDGMPYRSVRDRREELETNVENKRSRQSVAGNGAPRRAKSSAKKLAAPTRSSKRA
jgi:hypothetical protein